MSQLTFGHSAYAATKLSFVQWAHVKGWFNNQPGLRNPPDKKENL